MAASQIPESGDEGGGQGWRGTSMRMDVPLPGGTVVKNPPANAGEMGLNPGPGRSHMLQSN